jgi:purine catabolism regulator
MAPMAIATDTTGRSSLITVRAALALAPVRRGLPEVIASERNLDRPVRWVHAGEVPNMASLLKGGELLLTTGMGLQGGEAEQRRFIAELADRNVSALAIELGTTFAKVPAPLVEEADERGLPLVALHREVPFVEITEALHREIVNRQFVVMRRSDELHRRFTDLVLAGAGIPEVLSALAGAIANPVVLERAGQGVLFHATHHTPSGAVLAAWDAAAQGLAGAPQTFSVEVPTTGREAWGRLAAIAVDSPLDEFDGVAVERAVELIALALLRSRQEEVLAVRERGNFLGELLSGQIGESEAATRAAALGFDRRAPFLLAIAVIRAPRVAGTPAGNDDSAWAMVWRDVRRELAALGMPVIVGTRPAEGDVLLVVGLDDPERRAHVAERAAGLIHAAVERQLRTGDAAIVCVGGDARSWSGAADRLRDTIAATAAAATAPRRGWHDATRADLHQLMWALRDSDVLGAFVERRLAPLVEHDRNRKSKLLPTLEAYCAHGGRKAETARALHLERQSLYHRLERIEALLGEDLSDDDTVLALHLALRARPYVEPGAQAV